MIVYEHMDRRNFLARVVQFFSACIGLLFALPLFSFVRSSLSSGNWKSAYPIGKLDTIQQEVQRVSFTRVQRDGWMLRTVAEHVWVRKKPDGSVIVFDPHCTHLGCAYDWDPKTQHFLCPCHGGVFDKDGNRIEGPPPRGLDRFNVTVEDGQLRIDKLVKA